MTDRDYLHPEDDDIVFCLTIAKGTLKAGNQILRYMRIVKEDIRNMISSLENAMFQLKEMYLDSCKLVGVSPEDVPEVSEMLERLEEEEDDISTERSASGKAGDKPLELDPDLSEGDYDWDDEDDDDSYGGRGIVYGGSDN
jgi:hypothetical protein